MKQLILVCGSTGAGKTTYAIALAKELKAIRFSIDPWMQTLFAKDMTSLDYSWMIDRVYRCYAQIWDVSKQILEIDGKVILDLGFTSKDQRHYFIEKANEINVDAEIHYIDVPVDVRRQRVKERNSDKPPELFAFEVTDMMFNFIERKFEAPSSVEMKNGQLIKGHL